jgi:hypothetical protein
MLYMLACNKPQLNCTASPCFVTSHISGKVQGKCERQATLSFWKLREEEVGLKTSRGMRMLEHDPHPALSSHDNKVSIADFLHIFSAHISV